LYFDIGTRERGTVAFTDLIVGVALGPSRHNDQVRRHLRSMTMAAHAIAAAVTVIVIAGQLSRRKSLPGMLLFVQPPKITLRKRRKANAK
jgi:hypothetical protein